MSKFCRKIKVFMSMGLVFVIIGMIAYRNLSSHTKNMNLPSSTEMYLWMTLFVISVISSMWAVLTVSVLVLIMMEQTFLLRWTVLRICRCWSRNFVKRSSQRMRLIRSSIKMYFVYTKRCSNKENMWQCLMDRHQTLFIICIFTIFMVNCYACNFYWRL